MQNSRITAIDSTKGVLVLFMVVYHSLNYSTNPALSFRYFSFLPPSFIIITGYLISKIYLTRVADAPMRVYGRLWLRGARLFALFTVLNVAAQSLIHQRARGQMAGVEAYFEDWYDVYVTGNGRIAIFEVLLPIAYFLLCAPILIMIARQSRMAIVILAAVVLGAVGWASEHGEVWANVDLLAAGVLGMAFGCFSPERYCSSVYVLAAAVVAYAGDLALMLENGTSTVNQMLSACLALVAIFGVCMRIPARSWFERRLELLGRYSLVAYIGQIVIIFALAIRLGRAAPDSLEFLVLFIGALVLTQLTVEILDGARGRSKLGDALYTAVFA